MSEPDERTGAGREPGDLPEEGGAWSAPRVPVSWGELLDKTTILEIKERRLRSPGAVANVVRELEILRGALAPALEACAPLAGLMAELAAVNEVLWEVEDRIREKEAGGVFDTEFIELSRAVYIENDRRGALKRRVDRLMASEIVEEKQYTSYRGQGELRTPDLRPPLAPG